MALTDKERYRVIDDVNSYYRLTSESRNELLLNKYPNAAAAYSLRLLDGYYRGPLVRVRRDDGVEVDVYPDYNNQLSLDSLVSNVDDADDTTTNPDVDGDATFTKSLNSLGEFVSNPNYVDNGTAVNATVCVWYDQSSNNDASQATAANQPKIYDSSTGVVTANGKPTLDFDGVNDYLQTTYDNANNYTAFYVQTPVNSVGGVLVGRGDGGSRHVFGWSNGNNVFHYRGSSTAIQATGTASQYLGYVLSQPLSANCRVGYNGSTGTTSATIGTGGLVNMVLGAERSGFIQYGQGNAQEIIIYPSDQSDNRTGIEEDINDYYKIEGFESPQPLLDEFSGAAAAYSLRKLSSTYSGPLVRIRRVTDHTEVDVYPDSDGEFSIYSTIQDGDAEITTGVTGGSTDKTTLHEFLYENPSDCVVARWYDQSGSSNHAEQDVETSQPKIYDSVTGVVTENGKPAIQTDGLDDTMTLASTINFTDLTWLTVTKKTDTANDGSIIFFGGGSNAYGGDDVDNQGNPRLQAPSASIIISNLGNTSASGGEINQHLSYYNRNGTNASGGLNGEVNTEATVATTTFGLTELFQYGVNYNFEGLVQELILYDSNKKSDRSGIESNINTHYNIY